MSLGKRYEIYLPITYNPDEQRNRLPIEMEALCLHLSDWNNPLNQEGGEYH